MTNSIILCYVPFPDAETAREAARRLVEAKLCACVQLLPAVSSLYIWEGVLTESTEYPLLAKCATATAEAAKRMLEEEHPYECPCVLTIDAQANPAFARWAEAGCAPQYTTKQDSEA